MIREQLWNKLCHLMNDQLATFALELTSDVENLLLHYGALEKPSPALRRSNNSDDDSDLDSDGGDVGTVNARAGGIRGAGRGPGTGRQQEDSDDSDFDM